MGTAEVVAALEDTQEEAVAVAVSGHTEEGVQVADPMSPLGVETVVVEEEGAASDVFPKLADDRRATQSGLRSPSSPFLHLPLLPNLSGPGCPVGCQLQGDRLSCQQCVLNSTASLGLAQRCC